MSADPEPDQIITVFESHAAIIQAAPKAPAFFSAAAFQFRVRASQAWSRAQNEG
jgi:hypothetical protein